MKVQFMWVLYALVIIGFLVSIGLLLLRWRGRSSSAPDARIVVAIFSTLVIWRAGSYMNPDQAAPDSPLWDLILMALFLLAANEAVWRLHRSVVINRSDKRPNNSLEGDAAKPHASG